MSSERSCVDENALLMSEVRGEWTDWLEIRKATVTQITTRYNQGMQNTISEAQHIEPWSRWATAAETTPGSTPIR